MFRNLSALLTVLAVVFAACGSSPAATTPTQAPTVAAQTSTPQSTSTTAPTQAPTAAPTVAPTVTPRPTPKLPLLVEVASDADVEELFVCLPPAEVAKLMEGNTFENFKLPVPFNPKGLEFTISAYKFTHPAGDVFTVITFSLLKGTAVVKSYQPTWLQIGYLGDPAKKNYLVIPLDERKPSWQGNVGPFFPFGGPGAYTEVSPEAKPLVTIGLNDRTQQVGRPFFEINASAAPVPRWASSAKGQFILWGRDQGPNPRNASPITADSLLKRDGKFVCIQ